MWRATGRARRCSLAPCSAVRSARQRCSILAVPPRLSTPLTAHLLVHKLAQLGGLDLRHLRSGARWAVLVLLVMKRVASGPAWRAAAWLPERAAAGEGSGWEGSGWKGSGRGRARREGVARVAMACLGELQRQGQAGAQFGCRLSDREH
jgi:hypothetical protein